GAAGGILPAVRDGIARETVPYTPDLVADYAGVTGGQPRSDRNVPDVLVGLGWPSVFAVLSEAQTDAGTPVSEGMLDLVHLDHQIPVEAELPDTITHLVYTTGVTDVRDTEMGRVVNFDSVVEYDGTRLAQFSERFAIRGRTAATQLADPPVAAGTGADAMGATPRRSRLHTRVPAPRDMRAVAQAFRRDNALPTQGRAVQL